MEDNILRQLNIMVNSWDTGPEPTPVDEIIRQIQALVEHQVLIGRKEQVISLETLGDPILQEKYFDEVIAELDHQIQLLKEGKDE